MSTTGSAPTTVKSEHCRRDLLCSTLNKLSTRYLILDILGQGTFGQVVKCQNMKNHEIVAVKVVKNKPAYFNQSMMEVTILELVSALIDLSATRSIDTCRIL
jgi:serine/threonine protein kinase